MFSSFCLKLENRRSKKKFIDELKKGDKIVTNGGIHGKISELKDLTAIIDTGGNTKIKINRAAISMEATELSDKSTE